MQATIGYLPFLCNGVVNTTIEEAVFSVWLAYIHCWATDVFYWTASGLYKFSSRKSEVRSFRVCVCEEGLSE
jgi:hypothetical protein